MNWPICFRERLRIGNLESNVGIVTLWTPVERILKDIPDGTYAIAGQLYTKRGVNFIFRNILANPRIRYLIVCGADRAGSGEALLNFQVFGEEVSIHLGLQQSHARPIGFVDVLGSLRVELEGSKDDDPGSGHQRLRLFDGQRHLPLFQGSKFGAEGNDHTLRLAIDCLVFLYGISASIIGLGLRLGM